MKKILAVILFVLAIVFLAALPAMAQGVTPVVPPNDVTPIILGVCGLLLSLLFSYVPALKVWYGNQKNNGLLMVLFVAIVSAAYFGLSCSPYAAQLNIQVACTQLGAVEVFWGFVACLTGNQLTYLTAGATPIPNIVVPAKPAG